MKRLELFVLPLLLVSCGNNKTYEVTYESFHESTLNLTDNCTRCSIKGENLYKYFTESEIEIEYVDLTFEKTETGWEEVGESSEADVLTHLPLTKRAKDFEEETYTKYFAYEDGTFEIRHHKSQKIDNYYVIDEENVKFDVNGVITNYEELSQENDDSFIACKYTLTWM